MNSVMAQRCVMESGRDVLRKPGVAASHNIYIPHNAKAFFIWVVTYIYYDIS
jgi:hypothetical protein